MEGERLFDGPLRSASWRDDLNAIRAAVLEPPRTKDGRDHWRAVNAMNRTSERLAEWAVMKGTTDDLGGCKGIP